MHLLNRYCQYDAYKDDKSNFVFKRMLFAKFTPAHAAIGRGACHLLRWLFFSLLFALILHRQLLLHRDTHSTIVHLPRAAIGSSDCLAHKGYS